MTKTITRKTNTHRHIAMAFQKLSTIALLAIVGLVSACGTDSESNVDGGGTEDVDRPVGWGEATHSAAAEPNYDLLFDDEIIADMEVHRIDLVISQSV